MRRHSLKKSNHPFFLISNSVEQVQNKAFGFLRGLTKEERSMKADLRMIEELNKKLHKL